MSTAIGRPELDWSGMPERMRALPVDKRGYPVPWFVLWIDGEPEFRAMDVSKWRRAVRERLCWVCGGKLGAYLAFVIGPMCGVNRTTSEPPCHLDCARWSVRNCPFLARPHMDRRQHEQFTQERGAQSMGGFPIKRNPGVALVWVTRGYELWEPGPNEILIEIGEPIATEWYAEGRTATRAEIAESVRTGLPYLEELAAQQAGAMEALRKQVAEFQKLWPEE